MNELEYNRNKRKDRRRVKGLLISEGEMEHSEVIQPLSMWGVWLLRGLICAMCKVNKSRQQLLL